VPAVTERAAAGDVQEAVGRAVAAFPAWRDLDPIARSSIFIRAAAEMRSRRDELSGILIRKAGKTWREADADVCEAIDFCEFYARMAVPLFRPKRLGRFVGELNEVWYQPRGVAAVISPWNFPAAILVGMTVAGLVTGNAAVVKPSTQTPGIARVLCEILWRAGVPPGVLQFLPGPGSVVGAALVCHPQVAIIAFTGSKQVGLDILQSAGRTPEEQGFVKKVVCEMGGKNAIVVDESADLDEAVLAVRQSAFGYSGQKCSACSRAIVTEAVYDTFLIRLVQSTRTLVLGDPLDPGTDVGPAIDEAIKWANASTYRLTGGLFSRKPSHLEKARREFRVGNLYLNRGVTGALVGRQPFGGFGLSGTGTQAGGADYLLHFVEPRACCENTMRHGFAPGLD
jgi:RHH-type proline utilization regulon transcriptional repressor/proline dehydrogenase/delta 1-pyrroline-5-carboxylate dehydrogenase